MIAFLLFLIGIAFHLAAMFVSFGVGVEIERVKGSVEKKEVIAVYAIIAFIAEIIGVILIMASMRVT